ncbi:chlorophyllase-like protein [Mumia flava]|uniref:Chlorophyllase-like protein n=1 Tax=Mumia flava TaxID=1348852 RepID=A0A2M9B8M5_9ACTN|nr:hypothetical protein [Mumia flava]PJJ54283.1 chlorophyllase-like protein [Mumia flava]
MIAIRRTIRTVVLAVVVAGVLLVGIAANAGAYLMDFTAPAAGREPAAYAGLSHARPGPYGVGLHRFRTDEAPLDLTVWYPARVGSADEPALTYTYGVAMLSASSPTALATYGGQARLHATPETVGGPYPLVVLSSGFAITPESYGWLAEHLASYGLVVVAPDHREALDPRRLWEATRDRPDDVAATRAYVASAAFGDGELGGVVDPDTVAVVGHSYGGATALAAGGARVDADAFDAACTEAGGDGPLGLLCDALLPRLGDIAGGTQERPSGSPVDAVVSLAGDAAMFGRPGLAAVTAPVLTIGGTADHDSPFAWTSALAYESVGSARRTEVALEGAGHFVFTGPCARARRGLAVMPTGFCSDPAWERHQGHAVVRHYVAAFLLAELDRDVAARTALAPGRATPDGVRFRATGS